MSELSKDLAAALKQSQQIPDREGEETGLRGVKAPFSYRQEGDIRDRLQAAGKLGPYDYKKN